VGPEVDHVVAKQHRGATVLSNLAMACFHCNAHKGPNVAGVDPHTGSIVRLFHPRTDRWADHFEWAGGELVGRSAIGRVTIVTLFINDPLEVASRASLMEEGVF
jgi:hypothetical protein